MRSTTIGCLSLLLLSACGEMPVDGLDGSWDAGWDESAEGLCRVPGTEVHLSGILARADDGTVVEGIRLLGVPATVTIAGEDEKDLSARIAVEAAIAFHGEVDGPLSHGVAAAIEIGDGLVQLRPGAEIGRAFSIAGAVRGQIEISHDAQIESLDLPCAALSLDDDARIPDEQTPPEADSSRWHVLTERCSTGGPSLLDWRAHHATLAIDFDDEEWDEDSEWVEDEDEEECLTELGLSSTPGADAAVTVLSSRSVAVTRLREVDGFMQVRAEFDYATLVGWLPRGDVEPLRGGLSLYGWGCGGCLGCCGGRFGSLGPTYVGPAAVAPGALVYADVDEQSSWAVVRQAEPFTVRHVYGSKWVTLTRIPGLEQGCRGFRQANVLAEAVELPDRSQYH